VPVSALQERFRESARGVRDERSASASSGGRGSLVRRLEELPSADPARHEALLQRASFPAG